MCDQVIPGTRLFYLIQGNYTIFGKITLNKKRDFVQKFHLGFGLLLLVLYSMPSRAQVNGGEYSFEYLRLSQTPHISALGGIAVANPAPDIMLSTGNPAWLREKFHTNLGLNYNIYYGGTRVSNLMYAHHVKKLQTTFAFGLQYLHYGSFTQTDAIGNVLGKVTAQDYSLNLTASRQYLERWRYGATLKWANSRLVSQRASALLVDFGVSYADTSNKIYLGAVLKNAGIPVMNYEKGVQQPLPVDLQIGFMKKMKKAPFAISVLGHHLYTWDVRYDNPADQTDNNLLFGDTVQKEKKYVADKLFRHFIFALDINLGKSLEISAGYNHMRRGELATDDKKGLSGFSFGAGLYVKKFTIHYARSYYHLAGAYNEIGINMQLNQLFALGTSGRKINWSEKFEGGY